MKTTVKDVRLSRFPEAIGANYSDMPTITRAINECVQRLIIDPRQPDTGWWGTWVPALFTITRAQPYIAAPTGVARIMLMDVCKNPIRLQNMFYEFLWGQRGYLPKDACCGVSATAGGCGTLCNLSTSAYFRGNYSTQIDVPSASYVRVYPTNVLDGGGTKRVLVQGLDANGLKIYSLDGQSQIEGFYVDLASPFTQSTNVVTSIYGIQKDYSYGDVVLTAVDTTTAVETTLARYEPGDTNPQFPRYYLDSLPQYCCNGTASIQVQTLCKLDYRPVYVDQDWVLIGNIPALIDEAQSIYHDGIQDSTAIKMSLTKHNNAVLKLQGELDHFTGKEMPAISVSLFGTAKLRNQSVGSLL